MIAPTHWIGTLARALEKTPAEFTPAEVHELRVALGRLGVWITLAGRRMLRDDLRWLRRSAAELRDLDVLLASHGTESWTKRLVAQRAIEAESLARHSWSERARALCFALGTLPALDESDARARLGPIVRRVRRAARQAKRAPADHLVLHRWRRRMRTLRYALELLEEPADHARELQDELGLLHDRIVALAHLAAVPGANQDIELTLRLQSDVARHRGRAHEIWRRVRDEWEQR